MFNLTQTCQDSFHLSERQKSKRLTTYSADEAVVNRHLIHAGSSAKLSKTYETKLEGIYQNHKCKFLFDPGRPTFVYW